MTVIPAKPITKSPESSSDERSIVFLVLSDIQIGRFGRLATNDNVGQSAFVADLVAHIRKSNGTTETRPTEYGIIGLGDLSSTAKPEEYRSVTRQLIRLCIHLNVPRHRVYLCPGNHDYDFDMSKTDATFKQRFQAYASFHNDFYSDPHLLERYPDIKGELASGDIDRAIQCLSAPCDRHHIPGDNPDAMFYFVPDDDLGLDVLAFNSACRCDHREDSRYGYFPTSLVKSSLHLPQLDESRVRIAIGHHSYEPLADTDDSCLRNPRELKSYLFSNGFRFVLHGHQHYFEAKTWTEGSNEISIIGAGASSAAPAELPGAPNQICTLHLTDAFAFLKTHIYDAVKDSWTVASPLRRIPLSRSRFAVFKGREQVLKANRDLILSAQTSVQQTFVKSGHPKPSSDAVLALFKAHPRPSAISVHRILSINSYEDVIFAEHCLALAKTYPHIRVSYFQPKLPLPYPTTNVLLIDSEDSLLMFSNPESWDTSAIFMPTTEVADQLTSYVSGFPSMQLSPAQIDGLKNDVLRLRPHTVAETVLSDIAGRIMNRTLFFGLVGSATRTETPRHALNDIDVLIICEKVTADFLRILKDAVRDAVASIADKGVRVVPEYQDGPVRPATAGKGVPVYQLHVLVYDKKHVSSWPTFIIKNRLLRHRGHGSQTLESVVPAVDDVTDDILRHKTWGLHMLRQYVKDFHYPCYQWEVDQRGHARRVGYQREALSLEDRLEFLTYVFTKTVRNVLMCKMDLTSVEVDDRTCYQRYVDTFGASPHLLRLGELVDDCEQYRQEGHFAGTALAIDTYRNALLVFIDELSDRLQPNAVKHVN